MKRKIKVEDFDVQINRLIKEGWKVESIKHVSYYIVNLSKLSGESILKKHEKLPLLSLLRKTMLIKICRRLDINHRNLHTHELIREIEKHSNGIILTAYDTIIKEKQDKNHDKPTKEHLRKSDLRN